MPNVDDRSSDNNGLAVTWFQAPTIKRGVRKDGTERDGSVKEDVLWPNEGGVLHLGLEELAKLVTGGCEAAGKYMVPLLSGATFRAGVRKKENFISGSVILLDVDEEGADLAQAQEALDGTWAAFYPSWNHTADCPRFRVVVPLSRPVDAREHDQVWTWLSRKIRGVGANCQTVTAFAFLPCLGRGFAPVVNGGDPLDVDALLGDNPTTPASSGKNAGGGGSSPSNSIRGLDEDQVIEGGDGEQWTAAEWAGEVEVGEKEQVFCPFAEDASLGSAFLRRLPTALMLVCTSPRHDHETPLRAIYRVGQDTPDAGVSALLARTKQGGVRQTISNVVTVLEADPRWLGRIWLDAYRLVPMFNDGERDRLLRDEDVIELVVWLDRVYRLGISTARAQEAVVLVARRNERDGLMDYLSALEWDGTERLVLAGTRGLGADNEVYGKLLRRWMIGAVARVFRPGCKFDNVLVLQGPQGAKKSTALRVLAGDEWFNDSMIPIGSADTLLMLSSAWIHEVAELDSIRRRDATTVKAFLSAVVDKGRTAYARNVRSVPRRCAMAATTNEDDFLRDPTGNRRFWVVPCGTVDLDWFRAERNQLWAEAVHLFKGGERWWLEAWEEWNVEATLNAPFEEERPEEAEVARWVYSRLAMGITTPFTLTDAVVGALGLRLEQAVRDKGLQSRVGPALRSIGCTRDQNARKVNGQRQRLWHPPPLPEDYPKPKVLE